MKHDSSLTIRIPSQLKHEVELEAARDKRTKAGVVILALQSYLNTKKENER